MKGLRNTMRNLNQWVSAEFRTWYLPNKNELEQFGNEVLCNREGNT